MPGSKQTMLPGWVRLTALGSVSGLSGEAPELPSLPFGEANKVQSAADVAVVPTVDWDPTKVGPGLAEG